MEQYKSVEYSYKRKGLLVKEGNTVKEVSYSPRLYIPNNKGSYTAPDGKLLEAKDFNSISGMNAQIHQLKKIGGAEIYGMKNVEYQYIQEHHSDRSNYDISIFNVLYFDIETARDREYGYAPPSNPFNPVTLITGYMPKYNEIVVWALDSNEYTNTNPDVDYRRFRTEFDMLKDFLTYLTERNVDIVSGWNIENYDIPFICGRYLGQYEHPGNASLGSFNKDVNVWDNLPTPFGIVERRFVKNQYNKVDTIYRIYGVATLDYMGLYKKFTYITRESYSLNHISYCELGEKKVDYSEHQHLQSLYERDYCKFVEYGIKDTILVSKLEDKLKLIDLSITIAYMVGCNVTDIFSPVKTWEIYLYNEMAKEYIIPPINLRNHEDKTEQYMGAYVKPPVPGKYNWVFSYDLNSLYPHVMLFANMSPETHISSYWMQERQLALYNRIQSNIEQNINDIIEGIADFSELKTWNVSMTPNGAMFSKRKLGVIPKIIKELYSTRTETKRLMLQKKQEKEDNGSTPELESMIASLNAKQMAIKILMNSLYGACGNSHFLYYNLDIAEGITSMGQVAIRYIANEVEKYLNEMMKTPGMKRAIYSDTDSGYFTFEDIAEKLKKSKPDITDTQLIDALDKFSNERIQPFIDESYERLRDCLNGYEQSLKMKREKIAISSIFVAKKRYTTAIIDDEGVRFKHPKIKTTGLESVRSSTPELLRGKLKELEEILLLKSEDEVHDFLSKMKKEFSTYKVEDIAIVKTVNDIEKWWDTVKDKVKLGTPLQVKAAILYNKVMLEHDPQAETIKSGDKIHLVYVKPSAKFHKEKCIAYPQVIPVELGLTPDVVDWDTMYEKTFLSAAQIVMNPLNIKARNRTVSLTDFF